MYFVLEHEIQNKYDISISGIFLNAKNELIPDVFNKGISVKGQYGDEMKIIVDSKWSKMGLLTDRLLTKIHINIPLLVLSNKAIDIINKFSANLEFIKLEILNGYIPINGYSAVNILDKIDCANYEESDITFDTYSDDGSNRGNIYTIDGLVLDLSKIPDNTNIFLLGRYEDPIVIMSESLKNAIEDAELQGFSFLNPEDLHV